MEIVNILPDGEYELIPFRMNQCGQYVHKRLIPTFNKPLNQLVHKHNLHKWRYTTVITVLEYFCLTMAEARHSNIKHWGAYHV